MERTAKRRKSFKSLPTKRGWQRAPRILYRMLRIPMTDTDSRGLKAEEAVFEALEYYKENKTEFPGGKRIVAVSSTMPFSQEDKEGKDIIVRLQTENQPGIEVLLIQVQDWWTRQVEKWYKERNICLVGIWLFNENKQPKNDQQIEEEARRRTLEALYRWFREENNEIVLSA